MKRKTTILVVVAILILAASIFTYLELRIIGEVRGPEFNQLTIGDREYSLNNGLDFTSADKGNYLGKATYGTSVFRLYTVKGDKEDKYIYAVWDWEGFFYVREK
ncbi:hypothetical protein SDC9_208878 [bioreactor metagenome]|uniref:Uncharacterized protein n=1 Tax=bioreactor metagenome TaxID=1076179 RepID=A0A645JLE2_9ZZZZ